LATDIDGRAREDVVRDIGALEDRRRHDNGGIDEDGVRDHDGCRNEDGVRNEDDGADEDSCLNQDGSADGNEHAHRNAHRRADAHGGANGDTGRNADRDRRNVNADEDGGGDFDAERDEHRHVERNGDGDEHGAGDVITNVDEHGAGDVITNVDEHGAGNINADIDEHGAGNVVADIDKHRRVDGDANEHSCEPYANAGAWRDADGNANGDCADGGDDADVRQYGVRARGAGAPAAAGSAERGGRSFRWRVRSFRRGAGGGGGDPGGDLADGAAAAGVVPRFRVRLLFGQHWWQQDLAFSADGSDVCVAGRRVGGDAVLVGGPDGEIVPSLRSVPGAAASLFNHSWHRWHRLRCLHISS